ncbi:enoyl-CoA hydratase/isomerase family protein [Paraburkholderia caballeronis]|uniref:Methylglutaconyl-CoA hydratase n=1 Tax=Paraburkholderia caballeronis TaxID=416943 RepID=A0A1H7JCE8_9BURK|nr:enoyl-CoA hydratase/isomerase family protein [Paraburkholderia caballeronis]PXW27503.1 methylglutaconyl-CoA hydratase [Paraburkholderia caballeronis]PXX02977.1 methylglutaconyl-CoA hydratase [Paraburkholderia caballeronis]RAK03702.1 methylglutaconyl-CoA hydratase [Paraburkholderia caballeronis]TDV06131.1 methylglutaconyl-CoA hydratase [Paraburkholderia caballeronis]TDV09671.1 methylglutaconyl-CoA hydratase [Paraburkholderia caballeronis]
MSQTTASSGPPVEAGDEPALVSERHGPVLRIVLNRPSKRNALDTRLLDALSTVLAGVEQDASVNAVVLTGAGNVFCAGVDLREMEGRRDPSAARNRLELLASVQLRLAGLAVPVVVGVNGPAVGAGAVLALCGDVVVMAGQASLAFPELSKGIAPYMVTPLLTHCVGRLAAFELLARGTPVSAADALGRGWATAVVPAERLAQETDGWAQTIAGVPRTIMSRTRSLMRAARGDAWVDALSRALDCYDTE